MAQRRHCRTPPRPQRHPRPARRARPRNRESRFWCRSRKKKSGERKLKAATKGQPSENTKPQPTLTTVRGLGARRSARGRLSSGWPTQRTCNGWRSNQPRLLSGDRKRRWPTGSSSGPKLGLRLALSCPTPPSRSRAIWSSTTSAISVSLKNPVATSLRPSKATRMALAPAMAMAFI